MIDHKLSRDDVRIGEIVIFRDDGTDWPAVITSFGWSKVSNLETAHLMVMRWCGIDVQSDVLRSEPGQLEKRWRLRSEQ